MRVPPELIERLEKATEPDREADAEIWAAIYCNADNSDADILARLRQEPPAKVLDDIWGRIWRDHGISPPRYTTSIDAALTLVPDFINRRWYVADSDDRSNGKPVATVYHPADILNGRIPRSEGATPAIALCIAALKAVE